MSEHQVRHGRRAFFAVAFGTALTALGCSTGRTSPPAIAPPTGCADPPPPIEQPGTPSDGAFAALAEEMRRQALAAGDQSFGAIVVKDGLVVGLGPSRVVTLQDATAHAEMEAIRDASRRLGTADLAGAVLYSTSRPCRMCETAAYWANVGRMAVGPDAADGGPPQYVG